MKGQPLPLAGADFPGGRQPLHDHIWPRICRFSDRPRGQPPTGPQLLHRRSASFAVESCPRDCKNRRTSGVRQAGIAFCCLAEVVGRSPCRAAQRLSQQHECSCKRLILPRTPIQIIDAESRQGRRVSSCRSHASLSSASSPSPPPFATSGPASSTTRAFPPAIAVGIRNGETGTRPVAVCGSVWQLSK